MTHTHYIRAGGRLVAIYKSGTGGLNTLRYAHTDHLGSITELTNETGGLVESLSYDPWGKRRNADWSDAAGQLYANATKRGYTGHEHLDEAGLIHMNGRVYDPDMGRMLSPDPFINQPANTQSYNRYCYVLNNPLSYTDPSGYQQEAIEEITIPGTPIRIRPLDPTTGLGASFIFSNPASTTLASAGGWFVLVPVTVYTPVTGSHIQRKTTKLAPVNSSALRKLLIGSKTAANGKGSKGLAYVNGASRGQSPGPQISSYSPEQQANIRKEIAAATIGVQRAVFNSEREAAYALYAALQPISTKYDIEIGAMIHRGQGVDFDRVIVGDVATQFLAGHVDIPWLTGFQPVASYHTHGSYSTDFSSEDRRGDIALNINGYVSWEGSLLFFDYARYSRGDENYLEQLFQ